MVGNNLWCKHNNEFQPSWLVPAGPVQRVSSGCAASAAPWLRSPPDPWDPGVPARDGPSAVIVPTVVMTSPSRRPSVAHSPIPTSPEPTSVSGSAYRRQIRNMCSHTDMQTNAVHPHLVQSMRRHNCIYRYIIYTHTHTHTQTHPFKGPFSRTTRVSQYQKGKTNLDFTEARDREWQWHQLGHMQVCISLQTNNHASTPPVKFFTGRMPFLPPNQQRLSTEGTVTLHYINTVYSGLSKKKPQGPLRWENYCKIVSRYTCINKSKWLHTHALQFTVIFSINFQKFV